MPLFYKLLVGNLVVVAAAVTAAAWLTHEYLPDHPQSSSPLVWLALGWGVLACTLVVNGALVRLALSPVADLERTARAVSDGETRQRVPLSPLADRDLERLIRSFNEMLDRLERYRARLQSLTARALAAQESERKRIARELHDDTAQRVAAVLLRLELLRRRTGDEPYRTEVDEIRSELADALESLRRFARGLRPPALDDLGLFSALEAHVRDVENRAGFAVEFERPGREPALDPTVELAAYRIVQEALANAHRHSSASEVRVSVSTTDDRLEIAIRDDGRGFDPESTLDRRDAALGIFGMKERAAYVGGTLELESRPGAGTEVRVLLPTAARDVGP